MDARVVRRIGADGDRQRAGVALAHAHAEICRRHRSRRTVSALRAAASSPILRLSLRVRIVFGLAVVFLMIAKPDAGESLLVLAVAAVVTLSTSFTRRTAPSTAEEGYR
jgi:cell division protein FtsW (lipid II flippase)